MLEGIEVALTTSRAHRDWGYPSRSRSTRSRSRFINSRAVRPFPYEKGWIADQPEMRLEGRSRFERCGCEPIAELFHQPRDSADQEKERLRGVWKDLGGSGDPSRQSAIDSAGPGLAPQYNSPVYLPDGIFVYRSGFGGEFAAPQDGIAVVDGLQMIAQRLASGRDAVFDHFRRLAQRSSLTVRSARHAVSRSSRVSRVQVLASVLVAAAVTAQTPPATLYGPASRSASAAVVPASRRPQAPCTPALSRSETSAVRSPPSPFPCSTPPAACRLACPPAPLPPLPAPLPAP